MGGKVKRILGGSAVGTALLGPGAGTIAGAAVGGSKFGQTTWNRLNGDGNRGGGSSKSSGQVSGAGSGGILGGNGSKDVLESDGILSDAKRRKNAQGGTLVDSGPETFGYGSTLGG